MPLPTGATIGILADNLRIRKSVLPIAASSATRWTRGLGLPRGGETVIYTGQMYQLIPYITSMNKAQGMLEDSPLANFTSMGRFINRFINLSGFMAMPESGMKARFNSILVNIASLLIKSGVEMGCLYEDDLYSGALAYDLGVDDVLEEHAQKVYSNLKKYGVKNIITVDPHTTNMLRSVFPSFIRDYDIKVQSYLEVLAERKINPLKDLGADAVIHDSCVYARYENMLGEHRALLDKAGVRITDPVNTGKFTLCCGGPAESLYPKKAAAAAKNRAAELKAAGNNVITLCPICLVNLQKAADDRINIEDISSYLARAYC